MLGLRLSFCAALVWAGASLGLSQCEMEEPRPSKAQKLFDKASHPKGKAALSDRLSWLESALDIHPEDPEVLMASAELTFKATSLDPDMWGF